MNQTVKTIAFWSVILLSGVLLWQVVKAGGAGSKEMTIAFSKFMQDVDHGDVSEVTLAGTEVHGRYKNATGFQTTVPANYSDMITHLRDKGVGIVVKDNSGNGWSTYLLNLSPLILFAALWFVMIRQMQLQRGLRIPPQQDGILRHTRRHCRLSIRLDRHRCSLRACCSQTLREIWRLATANPIAARSSFIPTHKSVPWSPGCWRRLRRQMLTFDRDL